MKIFMLVLLCPFGVMNQVFAGLPRTAVSAVAATIHGFYTTSDPTCMTGLKAAVKAQATGMVVDMTQTPKLGKGEVAENIKCAVMLMKNTVNFTWAAGDYSATSTTVSSGGVTTVVNDNVCNTGSTVSLNICRGTTNAIPAQIQADATEAGFSVASTCAANTSGTEIVPLFISTYSACTGDSTEDKTDCPNGTLNTFTNPSESSSRNGIKLVQPPSAPAYKFNMDFNNSVGATSTTACGNTGAPRFSFIPDYE